jgi:hypothetical protein
MNQNLRSVTSQTATVLIACALALGMSTWSASAAASVPPALTCSPDLQEPFDPVASYIAGYRIPRMGYCLSYDGNLLYGGVKWGGDGPLPHGGWAEVVYTTYDGREYIWRGDTQSPVNPNDVVRSQGIVPAYPGRYCTRFVWLNADGGVAGWHEGHCINL